MAIILPLILLKRNIKEPVLILTMNYLNMSVL